jgi:DNA-binding NarL/FixJ family response regulator
VTYDADEILSRMRTDTESDWPTRLLNAISRVPTLDEKHPQLSNPILRPLSDELSVRELALLRCMSRGMTVEMAAETSGISFDTARLHLKGARFRLKAKNTTHACCEAIRQGLIP